jgi:hypothetical protein
MCHCHGMAKARGGVVLATPKNSAGVRGPWFFSAADYGSYSYSSRQSIFNRPQKKSRTGAPPPTPLSFIRCRPVIGRAATETERCVYKFVNDCATISLPQCPRNTPSIGPFDATRRPCLTYACPTPQSTSGHRSCYMATLTEISHSKQEPRPCLIANI